MQNFKDTGAHSFYFNSRTGTIMAYKRGADVHLVIPAKIYGVPVVAIAPYAFAMRNIETLVIPETVREIGHFAFANNRLTSVTNFSSVDLKLDETMFIGNEKFSVVKLVNGELIEQNRFMTYGEFLALLFED